MLPKTIEGWRHFLKSRPDSFYMPECDECSYFHKCVTLRKKCFLGYKKEPKEYITDVDLHIEL